MSLFVHFAKLLLGQLLFLSLLRDAVVGPSRLESGQLSGAGLGTVWQPHGIHVSAIIKIVIVYESLGLSVTSSCLKNRLSPLPRSFRFFSIQTVVLSPFLSSNPHFEPLQQWR
jgi:hypothetical protein